MKKHKTQFSIAMGDFNVKVETKHLGKTAFGHFGIGTRNRKGDLLVEFAESLES